MRKPNWGAGAFAYREGDRLEGYFRDFTSAYLWVNHQRSLYPDLPQQTVTRAQDAAACGHGDCVGGQIVFTRDRRAR